MMPINRKQPFETIYIVFLTLDVLSRIPYWTLIYIFPSNRPRPTWSLAACLTTAQTKRMYSRRMIAHGYQADGFAVDQVLDQKTLKKSTVVVIPPANEKYLKGMALLDPGAYLNSSAREHSWTTTQAYELLKYSTITKIFTHEYRLAPQAPWPAQLIDAISAYTYLGVVGSPRCLFINSPWCDMSVDAPTLESNLLVMEIGGPIVRSHLASNGLIEHSASSSSVKPLLSFTSPYLSPGRSNGPRGSFSNLAPTFITYGDSEAFAPEIQRLVEYMERDGVEAEVRVGQDGMHDFIMNETYCERKRSQVWVDVGRWVDRVLVGH
ncbi:hypothetical protein JAAARDRAFT_74697 [Jaapia argillacea MUCL 33604]|uniref:Alpha/beta hydrolase fold-3 domain-containing protein n=1 Tax=Jaapia argillacea MUCL 33604 TaxID=933084 RepID=A0A067P426_9AGAM|nr:hypothetical protein JAAARDRAFT_74697 [Jaapia argillacea MUCL 33604]